MRQHTQSSFLMPLIVRVMPSGKWFQVVTPFTFDWRYRDGYPGLHIHIAAGFVTDLASIPTTTLLLVATALIAAGRYAGLDGLLLAGVAVVLLMALIPKLGRQNEAAVIHDALSRGEFTTSGPSWVWERKDADDVFLAAMVVLGVAPWKRRLMYWAVRIGGWDSWRKR